MAMVKYQVEKSAYQVKKKARQSLTRPVLRREC
jgi:hypothetical protein